MKEHKSLTVMVIMITCLLVFSIGSLFSNEIMRIKKHDQTTLEIPTSEIESISFGASEIEVPGTSITDVDGNMYETVKIGDQIWMTSNYRASKYNDGTPIPEEKDKVKWKDLKTGAFCWYNNDSEAYNALYGKLYNWAAVNNQKFCPAGWRVPTDEDWTKLVEFLGGEDVAGGAMKAPGTIHWKAPNTEASNKSGMNVLSTGFRSNSGDSYYIGTFSYYWSSTQDFSAPHNAWSRKLSYNTGSFLRSKMHKGNGLYVRLIKE